MFVSIRTVLLATFVVTLGNTVYGNPPASSPPNRLEIDTPMAPPEWALLERQLLESNTLACEEFYSRYFDERGYLRCVVRWGADDGPDDAMENVADWPLLHSLGGSDVVLEMYKKVWEGHLRQYTEAKTIDVALARDGMYFKEFPTMFDWMHNAEGLRVFNLQGLSDPDDSLLQQRTRRFAGFYMNEDPLAPNYDPQHRIIRSMFTGSRGPLMRKATALDWAGDPIEVEGRFRLLHGERSYDEMLAHFKDYTETIGDHPQNMGATTLALNAFMLTGEDKYRRWLLEYVDAWQQRTEQNGGITPSNIGLDGRIGGAVDGKWYGGTYGWGFSVIVPQTGETDHRSRVGRGMTGFLNAFLLTGDRKYIDTWTGMLRIVNAAAATVDGNTVYPRMFNEHGWYAWQPTPWSEGALECWFLSGRETDRELVSANEWLEFIDGRNPSYPVTALRKDLERVRSRVTAMRSDATTPDTRLADDPMVFNPASVQSLNQLMQGGLDPGRAGGPLHCRLRYFDRLGHRAGLPENVAALVENFDGDSVTVTLVNTSQTESRDVIVQCGAYGEHQCATVNLEGQEHEVGGAWFSVRILPGCGARLMLKVERYSNTPVLAFPWTEH